MRAVFSTVFLTVAAAAASGADQADVAAATRTIYVAVTDATGRPVLDMDAADFEVRETGDLRPVELLPVNEPLRVALIVSRSAPNVRLLPAAKALCEQLEGNGDVSVISVHGDKVETVSDFSDRVGDCLAAVSRLATTENVPGRVGAALVDTILKTAKAIGRENRRAAIVVLRAGDEQSTPLYGERLQQPLRTSGAVLYLASTPAEGQASPPMSVAMSTLIDAAIESGGRHVVLGSDPAVVRPIAWELATSYRIRYIAPPGARSGARLTVTSRRPGVKVLAPTRVNR